MRVLDFGFQDQTPFLVMEFTPNGTLRTRHPKGTRLPLEQIVHYVKQIAPALDYAHKQHVIHRDVKPENMLFTANDEIVLSDFGIAVVHQSLDSLSTQSQAGTPVYMAPEQIQRKPCAASDQYALGVLVYEWLCGEPPFRGSLFEVLSQHLYQPPLSLCARVPDLPQAIEDAVFGALAKEPHARFVSVQDFAEVLENVCDATQTLSLRLPAEHPSREQISPFDTLAAQMDVPSPKEEDRSSSSTQPLVLTHQRTEETGGRVVLEILPSAAQTHALSQQKGAPVSHTNRQRLMRKVHAYWIAGVFEHSLHGAALLALGLQEQPDAVANPWQLVLQHPAGNARPLPAGTRIKEVYDAAEGELLILGAPGSGKSTLLLELARYLLERAEHDEQHPLPVVFNLSSWAIKQQPLAGWLVEELSSTYQVPHKLGQAWVDTDQILPLLDGLDEVAPKDRTACIESINTYREEHGLLPMVVCSRSADYLAQAARVRLGSAVVVQPLTEEQVNDYLASGGEPLWALRVALHRDVALRELTSSPLMLSILTLTYHDMPLEDLLRGGIAPTRQQIFEHYVERMLKHRGAAMRYTAEQTTHWLSWLARQLKQQNQTIFYIEHLQPDWLTGERMHLAYDQWALRFPAILMGMLITLAISLLLAPAAFNSLSGLAISLAPIIVLGGFLGWLLETGSTIQQPPENSRKARSGSWSRLVARLRVGILFGLSFGLINGLINGLLFGLRAGLASGLLAGLLAGLSFWLLLGFFQGVSSETIGDQHRVVPNQGIRRSAWNSLILGLISTAIVGLSAGLALGLSAGLGYGLSAGLIIGLSVGLLAGFLYGGLACLRHSVIRFLLWRAGSIPWNYPGFLDSATEHILLRKVGGGYIFVHRLLLEYFASLDTTRQRDEARAKRLHP